MDKGGLKIMTCTHHIHQSCWSWATPNACPEMGAQVCLSPCPLYLLVQVDSLIGFFVVGDMVYLHCLIVQGPQNYDVCLKIEEYQAYCNDMQIRIIMI